MSGFAVVKKTLASHLKKLFRKKKNPSTLFAQIRSAKLCADFLKKINRSRNI